MARPHYHSPHCVGGLRIMEKTVQVHSNFIRCPYCHDNVNLESDDWVACQQCLARHHSECWTSECSACHCPDHLQPGRGSSESKEREREKVGDFFATANASEGADSLDELDLSHIEPLDIKAAFEEGKALFHHKNYLVFALAGTVATLLSGASLFVLSGFLNAGLWLMGLRMLDEQDEDSVDIKVGDLFAATDQFGVLTVAAIVKSLIVLVGMSLLFLPGIIFESFFTYVIPLIAERKLGWKEAFKKSLEIVQASGLKQHFLLVLITFLITLPAAALSGGAAPIGAMVTGLLLPLTFGPWLAAYRQVLKRQKKARAPGKGEAQEDGAPVEDGIYAAHDDVDAVI